MDSPNRGIGTLIVFGLMASATFAEGARPPRLTKLEARAPIATLQIQVTPGARGPDESSIRPAFRFA
ncbi:MAG: hypothetical protein ABW023_08520 [Sphingomonas sp.]